jgi:hypothetical protein
MEEIGSVDAGRRGPAYNNTRSLDFACPEDVEGLVALRVRALRVSPNNRK